MFQILHCFLKDASHALFCGSNSSASHVGCAFSGAQLLYIASHLGSLRYPRSTWETRQDYLEHFESKAVQVGILLALTLLCWVLDWDVGNACWIWLDVHFDADAHPAP